MNDSECRKIVQNSAEQIEKFSDKFKTRKEIMVRIKCGKNVKYKDIEKMYSSLLKVSKVGCSIEILPNQDNYLEEDQIIVEIGQIYHCKYSEDISDIVEPSLLQKFTELIYKLKLEEF